MWLQKKEQLLDESLGNGGSHTGHRYSGMDNNFYEPSPSRSFSRVHGWFHVQTQIWKGHNKIMPEHVCVCVWTQN